MPDGPRAPPDGPLPPRNAASLSGAYVNDAEVFPQSDNSASDTLSKKKTSVILNVYTRALLSVHCLVFVAEIHADLRDMDA